MPGPLLVAAIAFLVRILPWFDGSAPLAWEDLFHGGELGQIARNLEAGRGFSSPFAPGDQPSSWFGPVVPTLWAVLFRIHGPDGPVALSWIVWLQAAAAAATCALYVALFRTLALEAGQSAARAARWGLGFGLVMALWPDSVRLGIWPSYLPWQELGTVVLMLCILRWLARPTWSSAVAMGVSAGVTALVNPVPLPLVAYPLVVTLVDRRSPRARQVVPQAVTAIAVAMLVIAPWVARNKIMLGAWIPVRANFGVELRQGNNPEGTIAQNAASVHPALREEERRRYDEMGEAAYSAWAAREALDYMRANPRVTARRMATRAGAFWLPDLFGETGGVEAPAAVLLLAACAIVPVVLLVVALLSRIALQVPHWPLLAVWLGALPLPYYLTNASRWYAFPFKPYLLLWVCLSLLLFASRRPAPDAETTAA